VGPPSPAILQRRAEPAGRSGALATFATAMPSAICWPNRTSARCIAAARASYSGPSIACVSDASSTPHAELPPGLQDDRLAEDAVETRDADLHAVRGTAGKKSRSPGHDRDLLGVEAISQRRDQRIADLVVERTAPAVELRDDELVGAGAGDDLRAVDVVRKLDRSDRQRHIGRARARAVPDLDRLQRVEPRGPRASQAARHREGHRAGDQRRQSEMAHPGHCFPFSTASGWSSR